MKNANIGYIAASVLIGLTASAVLAVPGAHAATADQAVIAFERDLNHTATAGQVQRVENMDPMQQLVNVALGNAAPSMKTVAAAEPVSAGFERDLERSTVNAPEAVAVAFERDLGHAPVQGAWNTGNVTAAVYDADPLYALMTASLWASSPRAVA